MRKRITLLFLVIFIIGLVTVPSVYASSDNPLSREQVFTLLQEGFQAQTSLTYEFRTFDEVVKILNPYFHEGYSKKFLEENLIQEDEGYIVYGSDFALYFIPFYSYSDKTQILFDQDENKIYVYEFFETPESGPVSYQDHYEIVTIENIKSNWLITDLSMEDEAPTVKNDSLKEVTVKRDPLFLTWNPFKAYLLEMEHQTPYFYTWYKNMF
ncbi:DUF3993 domain-containing protein [Bacillus sinesaloumensis]|uniref:DUF3993 domain-containing protein n=1 Tax=Litchfieldia sinesaloumensis TaxID=1926280 RepID=UPI0013566BBA|nr:DUF3993 domain-containing protein [Bacillus sinesaloumensis]